MKDVDCIAKQWYTRGVEAGREEERERHFGGPLLADIIRVAIYHALMDHRWNVSAAAKQLGISRSTMYRYVQEMGIEKADIYPGL